MPLDLKRIKVLCFDVDGTLSDTDDRWVSQLSRFLRPFSFLSHKHDPLIMARRLIMMLESPGNYLYHFFDRFGLDGVMARFFGFVAKRDQKKPGNFWLIPQTREVLLKLYPYYPMAIISARGEKGTFAFLNQFDLTCFFRNVATSQTCRYTKPFPDPILWVASQMGIKPEECLMIVSARGERSTLAFLDQFDLTRFFEHIATSQTCRYTKPFPDPIVWVARKIGVMPEECLMIGDTTLDIRTGKSAGAQTVGVLCGFGTETELRRAGADLILSCPGDLVKVLLPNSVE